MAHLETYRWGRKGSCLKRGDEIKMRIDGEILTGHVQTTDGGEWIYPWFPTRKHYPAWCRATEVVATGVHLSDEERTKIEHSFIRY